MPYAVRGNHRIHFEVAGPEEAPPLLLIMGMSFSSRAWGSLPERLARDFRVVVFDNRGTGRSSLHRRPYRIRHLAGDAAAVLDAAGVDRAHVFGISMGGMVGLELALHHADRVRSLALGATCAGWLRSRKMAPRTLGRMVAASLLGRRAEMLPPLFVSPEALARDPEGFARWHAGVERSGPWTSLLQTLAIVLHSTERQLSRLEVPTLVLTGDRDLLIPPENSRRLARLLRAELVVLSGAGHCFPVERPDETLAALERHFLGGRLPRDPGDRTTPGER
jgi:3-oxoadipate enol-lactonase